jgi:hypothetical protein
MAYLTMAFIWNIEEPKPGQKSQALGGSFLERGQISTATYMASSMSVKFKH